MRDNDDSVSIDIYTYTSNIKLECETTSNQTIDLSKCETVFLAVCFPVF